MRSLIVSGFVALFLSAGLVSCGQQYCSQELVSDYNSMGSSLFRDIQCEKARTFKTWHSGTVCQAKNLLNGERMTIDADKEANEILENCD